MCLLRLLEAAFVEGAERAIAALESALPSLLVMWDEWDQDVIA